MAVFASVLGRTEVVPSDTFVSLGGGSMSYIECSIRLEHLLGRAPGRLASSPHRRTRTEQRPWPPLVTSSTRQCSCGRSPSAPSSPHTCACGSSLAGAHLLFAVVGYNLSGFMMPISSTRRLGPRRCCAPRPQSPRRPSSGSPSDWSSLGVVRRWNAAARQQLHRAETQGHQRGSLALLVHRGVRPRSCPGHDCCCRHSRRPPAPSARFLYGYTVRASSSLVCPGAAVEWAQMGDS